MDKKVSEKKQCKSSGTAFYVLSSHAVAGAAFFLMPKAIDFLSTKLFNSSPDIPDDWGPEIVRREHKG